MNPDVIDPELDLLLERVVDVPPARVWAAWTKPEHVVEWFAPKPFMTTECDIDLRPGGRFRTVMQSPDGDRFETIGCYLEIVENSRLAWTTLLWPGFRPAPADDDVKFTAIISLESVAGGTKYAALAMHGDPATQRRHADMGFHDGWGTALDQLVAHAHSLEVKQ